MFLLGEKLKSLSLSIKSGISEVSLMTISSPFSR